MKLKKRLCNYRAGAHEENTMQNLIEKNLVHAESTEGRAQIAERSAHEADDRPKLTIRYDDTSDPCCAGWVVWTGEKRRWQPIIECTDPDVLPTLEEACSADLLTDLDPDDYAGVCVAD